MTKKVYQGICNSLIKLSPYVRFVGVIGKNGNLLAHTRRHNLKALLDAENTTHQFSHIAIQRGMESTFDKQLGPVEFFWEERKKVQIISFAIGKNRVWASIDKKVIRTEILRIIDSCLPIVKRHS